MKPECEELLPLLTAYVDGQLASAERKKVVKHLDFCEYCRNEVAELQETTEFIKNTWSQCPEPEVDLTGVWENIEQQLDFAPSPWERFKEWFGEPVRWVPVGLATAAVGMTLMLLPVMQTPEPVAPCQVEFVSTTKVFLGKTAESQEPIFWISYNAEKEAG